MKACWCTLPLTNPHACDGCPNRNEIPNDTNHWPLIRPVNQPVKRVIEEFDRDGKITKRITEEDVYPQYPLYYLTCTGTSPSVGDPTKNLPTTTCETTGGTNVTTSKQ